MVITLIYWLSRFWDFFSFHTFHSYLIYWIKSRKKTLRMNLSLILLTTSRHVNNYHRPFSCFLRAFFRDVIFYLNYQWLLLFYMILLLFASSRTANSIRVRWRWVPLSCCCVATQVVVSVVRWAFFSAFSIAAYSTLVVKKWVRKKGLYIYSYY